MQILSIPIGSEGALVSLSLSSGSAVISITVPAQAEVDSLLAVVSTKLGASFQPLIQAIQAGIDAELQKT